MLVRALLRIAASMPEVELGQESLNVAIIRFREALPSFLASDGAVLEAASGYLYYIFLLWKEITHQNILPSDIRTLIQERIGKTKSFLEPVLTCDQYLQGIGNSYSKVVAKSLLKARGQNEVFSFSNGLSGINFMNGDTCGQVLFVSLDTPPHIHNLPEDLAVYLYLGEPFSGIWVYMPMINHQRENIYFQSSLNRRLPSLMKVSQSHQTLPT